MTLPINEKEALYKFLELKNIYAPEAILPKAEIYRDLVLDWNKRFNLVSTNDRDKIITRHFIDSLSPLDILPEKGDLIDIGSGAGFPGIPLAIARPSMSITLLESVHKKALFLREAISQMQIQNISIIEARLEYLISDINYDFVTLRALPRWEKLLKKIRRLLAPSGKIIYYDKFGSYRLLEPPEPEK